MTEKIVKATRYNIIKDDGEIDLINQITDEIVSNMALIGLQAIANGSHLEIKDNSNSLIEHNVEYIIDALDVGNRASITSTIQTSNIHIYKACKEIINSVAFETLKDYYEGKLGFFAVYLRDEKWTIK